MYANREHLLDHLIGKWVCAECFDDYAIKNFINSNLRTQTCSYCGQISSTLVGASIKEVLEFILEGIHTEWVVNTPQVEWEAENYGWHGGSSIQSKHLITLLLPELDGKRKELFNDIIRSIRPEWRRFRQYDLDIDDIFGYRWDQFANAVKYQTRYTYYRINTDWQKDIANRAKQTRFKMQTSHVIEEVLDNISALNISRTLKQNTPIWRARIHDSNKILNTPELLGPPSFEQALRSTRMSPIGIPVFYGSLDRETAIAETVHSIGESDHSKKISLGKWTLLKDYRVLDLAIIPEKPSLFDKKRRMFRNTTSFLQSFSDIISEPILKDHFEHIEYVPTQVFSEYIKYLYKEHEGNKVAGILYKSSVKTGGINCVLYFTRDDCLIEKSESKNSKQKLNLDSFEEVPKSEVESLRFIPKYKIR